MVFINFKMESNRFQLCCRKNLQNSSEQQYICTVNIHPALFYNSQFMSESSLYHGGLWEREPFLCILKKTYENDKNNLLINIKLD